MSHPGSFGSLIAELKRRRVFRVAAVYAVVAWGLIQVADAVAEPLALPSWFVTVVILSTAMGFPLAVALAWAFDINPGQGVQSTDGDRPEGRMRRLVPATLVAMALVGATVALGVWPHTTPAQGASGGETTAGIESIAVLPFMNISSDSENEHFSDGLAEEILNSLAQVPGLRVAARTSSFAFRNSEAELPEIGRRLKVQTVLEGSVRQSANKLRITVQLIQVSDGYHLWSKVYERDIQDIFEIQDDISSAILQSLAPRFAASGDALVRHPTENVEAYDLYLRGRHRFWQGSTEAGLRESAAFMDQAIAADPQFSLAYAGLSDAYMILANHVPPSDVMPMAEEAATKALELDPKLAEGYVALASVNWLYDWDWAAADRNYRLSFSVNPLLTTRCVCYAWYLATVGDPVSAVAEAQRAREMDPVARLPHVILAWMYYLAGRYDDARSELGEIFAVNAADESGRRISAWILWDEGRKDEAVAEMEKIRHEVDRKSSFEEQGSPIVLAELAIMYAQTGRQADAGKLLDRLRERVQRRYIPPEYIAAVEAAIGDQDRAFRTMDAALENRSNLGQFSILPLSRPLRADPRYQQVLERIGLGRN